MSATTAGWILAPQEPHETLRRAGVISNESLSYELQYGKNVQRVPGGQALERQAWLEGRRSDLDEWANAAGIRLQRRDRINMTKAIEEVAAVIGDDEPLLSAMWNEMSSGAHGMGWHIQSRTFGQGTGTIEGSNFNAFPVALDLPYYLNALAAVTAYVEGVLEVASLYARDARVDVT